MALNVTVTHSTTATGVNDPTKEISSTAWNGTGAHTVTVTVDDNTLVAAKLSASATDVVFGRSAAGAGAGEEIAVTAAGRALLDDANAAAQLVTLGLTATAAELNYTDGVNSAIQTQLDAKVDTANSPNANEFARFTDADTIEGLTVAEALDALGIGPFVTPGGRLTLESGVGVSSSDQKAKTILYYTPYKHGYIGLYDGAAWDLFSFTERSLTLPTLTATATPTGTWSNDTDAVTVSSAIGIVVGQLVVATNIPAATYVRAISGVTVTLSRKATGAGSGAAMSFYEAMADVFLYDNAGTLTLELTMWTNHTTRATALTTQNGVSVKTGALTRRYLGNIMYTSATATDDALGTRMVWNYDNKELREFSSANDGGSGTMSSAATTLTTWNVASAAYNTVDLISGIAQSGINTVNIQQNVGTSGDVITTYGVLNYDTTLATGAGVLPETSTTALRKIGPGILTIQLGHTCLDVGVKRNSGTGTASYVTPRLRGNYLC